MTVAVTGGAGRLAQELARQRPDIVLLDRGRLDVTDAAAVSRVLGIERPDAVIHAAGMTDLVRIERERGRAYQVHATGTANIVTACLRFGIRLVYPSTDYVFSGEKPGGLYREDERPDPVSFYGETKVCSEDEAQHVADHLIIRGTMKDPGWKHPVAPTDMWQSILLRPDYASILLRLVDLEARGTFHVGGPRVNVFAYAKAARPEVRPCLRADLKAFRLPKDCSLDTAKTRDFLTISA